MVSHSRRLRQKIELVRPQLSASAEAMWTHPHLADFFPEYLFAVHCISRATVPSMRAAEESARALASHDSVAAALAAYFEKHSAEEVGHDEWTLEDLEVLGIPRAEVLNRVPSPAVASLVGAQYYWARHHHPIAYMGYIAVLEGPASIGFLEETVQRTGLPRAAFRTHFLHAELDPHHMAEFAAVLDRLPLTAEHSSALAISAFTTVESLSRVFEEIVLDFEHRLGGTLSAVATVKV